VAIQNNLIALLLQVIADSHREPCPRISEALSDLLRHIESRHQEPLPLRTLASQVGLSLPRFKARFRQEVGIPPAEYVLRCKVSAAQRQLTNPHSTVTDVAYSLGFSSSQYFATVFRRYTGQTPRQFQRVAACEQKDN
jgi:AraC-like DNA-binding protein